MSSWKGGNEKAFFLIGKPEGAVNLKDRRGKKSVNQGRRWLSTKKRSASAMNRRGQKTQNPTRGSVGKHWVTMKWADRQGPGDRLSEKNSKPDRT